MRTLTAIFLLLCCAAALVAATGDGQWLTRVPAKDADRKNPLAAEPHAAEAGENLFKQHCAECHGDTATGRNGKPSLRSERVAQATPGQLFWLLTNGSLKNGMPSWSRLPDQQRWALVTYVKTLPPK